MRRKHFPRVEAKIPSVVRHISSALRRHKPGDPFPPTKTWVNFPAEGNASGARRFDFAQYYGRGIDDIAYACHQQVDRFLSTHDGDLAIATIVAYCQTGLARFLDFLRHRSVALNRTLVLADLDRDLIDDFLATLDDGRLATTSQRGIYKSVKAVLLPMCKRGAIRWVRSGDDATFPTNPFPGSDRKHRGASPMTRAEKRAFNVAIKKNVLPVLHGSEPATSEQLALALLVVALHTGRNTTPLLELDVDCLIRHPKPGLSFLLVHKRRGGRRDNAVVQPDRSEHDIQSTPVVLPTVANLIRKLLELSTRMRRRAPRHLQKRLWIYETTRGAAIGSVSALTPARIGEAVKKLVEKEGLVGRDGKPLRVTVSILRKTFINRVNEILGDDPSSAAKAAGNSPQVVRVHYLRPSEDAQMKWRFLGEILVTELLTSTIGSTAKTPVARCSDPVNGQLAPKVEGATCMNFLNCVRCRNLVVTGDDLYRLFSYYWRIYHERERVGRERWNKRYAHIIRLIDRDIVAKGIAKRAFDKATVEEAKARARTNPHPFWALGAVFEVGAGQ